MMTGSQQLRSTQVFLLSPSHLDAQTQRPGRLRNLRQTRRLLVIAVGKFLVRLQFLK